MRYLSVLILSISSIWASNTDLLPLLSNRNELVLSTRQMKPLLFDDQIRQRLDEWNTNVDAEYIVNCRSNLKAYFPAENILSYLCYVLRQNNPKIKSLYKPILKRFFLETKAALQEIENDPRYKQWETEYPVNNFTNKAGLLNFLLTEKRMAEIISCFETLESVEYDTKNELKGYTPFIKVNHCLRKFKKIGKASFLPINLVNQFSLPSKGFYHPGHAVSETGWIPGNKVTYSALNSHDIDTYALAQARDEVIDNYVLSMEEDGLLEFFLANDFDNLFTGDRYNFSKHMVWSQKTGIFRIISDSIRSAEQTIFVDMFFIGGSMGVALVKEFARLLKEKPDLKIFVMKDNYNFFAYKKEIAAVYNYLLSLSYQLPDRIIVSESYIDGHTSGLPQMMHDFVESDDFFEDVGLKKMLFKKVSDSAGLYVKAKSDHSKVVIIDAGTNKAKALVGSKNFTDSSGALCFDDITKVEGPAASVISDDYYYDMYYALLNETSVKRPEYFQKILVHGWAKELTSITSSKHQAIVNLLAPFDLIDRDLDFKAQRTSPLKIVHQGSSQVRTGHNNVDSTRTNVLDEILQLIQSARKNIFIMDQFLFDRNVIKALVQKKKQSPHLDIRLILEGIRDGKISGFPNNLYLSELEKVGIKTKKIRNQERDGIYEEFHYKTISADGKYLITGSANKDQTTMYGSFREQQLDIFEPEVAAKHDKVFEHYWQNQTDDFRAYDFDVSFLYGLDGKEMKPQNFIYYVRSLISILFDAERI
jgi:phosphatidylserine/phosphatidylglycerophosphate/cardiolipin synthase-like enzyme